MTLLINGSHVIHRIPVINKYANIGIIVIAGFPYNESAVVDGECPAPGVGKRISIHILCENSEIYHIICFIPDKCTKVSICVVGFTHNLAFIVNVKSPAVCSPDIVTNVYYPVGTGCSKNRGVGPDQNQSQYQNPC